MPTYLFENHTKSEFILPKRTASGIGRVPAGATMQGDDYFTQFVPQFLRIIRVISNESVQSTQNPITLILDQPDTVTLDGKVEYVAQKQQVPLNEKFGQENQDVVLLNENPLSGVEIL